jgi:lipoprotein-releasing system permease protein
MAINLTEFIIAFRYLRAKKKEGFLSVIAGFSLLGIALGVAALIVVMAVMKGYDRELTNITLGFSGHVTVRGPQNGIINYQNLAEEFEEIKNITKTTPMIIRQAMASHNDIAAGVEVRALSDTDLRQKEIIANNIIIGNLNDIAEDDIVIGVSLANKLYLDIGDNLSIISPSGTQTLLGNVPRIKTYQVKAIFKSGMYLYDSGVVFTPLVTAQLQFKLTDAVSHIEIMTNNPHNTRPIVMSLLQILPPSFSVSDWKMDNSSLLSALEIERKVMFLILTLIIIVAAFNIISSMIMLVNSKNKDIAILRTIGASRSMILRIFFICGSSIGIIGTISGVIIGVSFACNIEDIRLFLQNISGTSLFDPVIYYLAELPAEVEFDDVIRVICISLTSACIATFYPAWKAAKLEPAEVMRNE